MINIENNTDDNDYNNLCNNFKPIEFLLPLNNYNINDLHFCDNDNDNNIIINQIYINDLKTNLGKIKLENELLRKILVQNHYFLIYSLNWSILWKKKYDTINNLTKKRKINDYEENIITNEYKNNYLQKLTNYLQKINNYMQKISYFLK